MTIAISLKVNDGLVLAADSASTLSLEDGSVYNVYNNANKIVNLAKGLPIGVITWGQGAIGAASMETLYKDLRRRLTGKDPQHLDWTIDPDNYSVVEVAQTARAFLYEEHYLPAYGDWDEKPALGCIVAGYSAGGETAEGYRLEFRVDGSCPEPAVAHPADVCGINCSGQPAAVWRLLLGFDPRLRDVFRDDLKIPERQIDAVLAVIEDRLSAPMIEPSMPIQDAIELAEFLVDVAEKFSRFNPGAETVGGPIEIAAITKHEQFRWIKRKYYYRRDMNPEEGPHARHDYPPKGSPPRRRGPRTPKVPLSGAGAAVVADGSPGAKAVRE